MAYFPPGWDPNLATEKYQVDLDIANAAILRIPERLAEYEDIRDTHKVFWDYWNPLVGRFELYVKNCNGIDMEKASLVDSDVEDMAATDNNDVIFPINDGYYGPEPKGTFMYGPYYGSVVLGVEFVPNEKSQIAEEQAHYTSAPGDDAPRAAAQVAQSAALGIQITQLTDNIAEMNEGVAKYPWLSTVIAQSEQALAECAIAKDSVDDEISAESPYPYTNPPRVAFLIARDVECGNSPELVSNTMYQIYTERYTMTNARANISSGSISPVDALPNQLAYLEKEKARLESLISSYGDY